MEAGVGVGSSSLAYIGSLILGKEKSLLRVGCAVLKQGLLNPEPPPIEHHHPSVELNLESTFGSFTCESK